MPIPSQTINVRDPGLGLTEPAPTTVLVMGVSALGTAATLYTYANKNAAVAEQGQGPGTESLCHVLDVAGGPVHFMPITASVAGTIGAVTPHVTGGASGTVTTAGVPLDGYEAQITIVEAGTVGVGTFNYSLDDGNSVSEEILIPLAGTYLLPNTGITITFVPGAGPVFFNAADWHEFDCIAPQYAVADLATAVTALLLVPATVEFPIVILSGTETSAANAATMFGAVETHAATLAAAFRYTRWFMDGGTDTAAAWIVAFAAVDDLRVAVTFGTADTASGKAFAGWASPAWPTVNNTGARVAADLMSTDAGRVASGGLQGVTAISHDEYQTPTLDVNRATTTRTWPGRAGFYLTNGRLKSIAGSDFLYIQHGRVIDAACRRIYLVQQGFIGISVRTNATTGTIDERDAVRLETRGEEGLRADLTQPTNAEGTPGHVSDVSYAIDRTNNVLTTFTILSEVGVLPLGYVKWITTTVGFDLSVGA